MKVYEILSLNREFLERLNGFGINLDDCHWIGMYYEYLQMKNNGDKIVYIVAFLSEKYNVCERKIYKLIKTMEKDCNIGAV